MKVWILNHYAGEYYRDKAWRHYWIAKYLKRMGHEPLVFCSNAAHGSEGELYYDTDELWHVHMAEEIDVPFVFVKSRPYAGNGKSRILNMVDFYRNTLKSADGVARRFGKPHVVYASSVHPLALVAGIRIARRFGIRCVCEVRDLWPLSLVVFSGLKEGSLLTRLLYRGEHWIYRKADELVFTFNNGKQYILDKGWEKDVSLDKIHYINNGIDLDGYEEKVQTGAFPDEDLDGDAFKIVYAGAMGPPNQINRIVDAAMELQRRNVQGVRFILFGAGMCRDEEEDRCRRCSLSSVVFKGTIEKRKVPYALSRADATIVMIEPSGLVKYGTSENKIFDYLAARKPIICNDESIRSVVGDSDCVSVDENVADAVEKMLHMDRAEYARACQSAGALVEQYAFEHLTKQFIDVFEKAIKSR